MTKTAPEVGVETTATPADRTIHTTDESPTVLLRNEDDTDHALDVRVAGDDTVLVEGCHTVAGDSQCAIAATAADVGLIRVELRADHGGAASLTVDMRHGRKVPEFVIRRETIVVAGLN